MEKKWITFDLDETLMQNPFMGWVFPEIVETIQCHLEDKDLDIMALIVDEHLKRMSKNRILEAYDWDHIVEELLERLQLTLTIDIEKIVTNHCEIPKIHLLEETILSSLQRIKEKGYALAVATNGYYKYQYPVLEKLQLVELFDQIITSDSAGYAKPDIQMLNSVKKEGELVAHVGDRIDHDILLANNLNITSIFINKNLPSTILELPVYKRKDSAEFIHFCKEKWKKENKFSQVAFHQDCIPDLVVHSISELSDYITSNGL
ncbi:HAD family hydrolase [Pseudogracilibacillus auburnensis]|uniref:HAD superfamily hydrolase (TIGR01549 family) n=1 Tax=Pseudogracilibacillus auburnensis TaxID=1494959 RepID=A0A2V3VVL5_9BACI|nr:HAD family hydrolase [Pseudogracilibacillus auburnensis]PXW85997.1 HAD superfamily hydrolase (TIGR01549 family) [Pseudogracilibacillus auburnensis]